LEKKTIDATRLTLVFMAVFRSGGRRADGLKGVKRWQSIIAVWFDKSIKKSAGGGLCRMAIGPQARLGMRGVHRRNR